MYHSKIKPHLHKFWIGGSLIAIILALLVSTRAQTSVGYTISGFGTTYLPEGSSYNQTGTLTQVSGSVADTVTVEVLDSSWNPTSLCTGPGTVAVPADGTANLTLSCTATDAHVGTNNLYIRTTSGVGGGTNSDDFIVEVLATSSPDSYSYFSQFSGFQDTSMEYDQTTSYNMSLHQTINSGDGSDTVNIWLRNTGASSIPNCTVSPGSFTFAANDSGKPFTLSCSPTSSNLGTSNFDVVMMGTHAGATESTSSFNFSIIAPVDSGSGSGGGSGGSSGSDACNSNNNWITHTWNFSDGSTTSCILSRTDSEYTNHIASAEAECASVSQNSYSWMSGAGDDSNWQEFGIPDCSGNTSTGNSYECYQNDSTNQRQLLYSTDPHPGGTWYWVAFNDCDGISPGNTANISDLNGNTGGNTGGTGSTGTTSGSCGFGELCSSGSWCNNGRACHYSSGDLTCVNWDETCPSGTSVCSPGDSNCYGPGETAPLNSGAWCMDSMQCYTDSEMYCAPMDMDYESGSTAATMQCPAGYNTCRPDDENCLEIGETGSSNAWCGGGGNQCHNSDGSITCVAWGTTCPSGSTVCHASDNNCVEPGTTGDLNAWCGGGNAVQCYSNTELYCGDVSSSNEPDRWDSYECPSSHASRCRPGDNYCLDQIGATGPSGSWCAVGRSDYNDSNNTVTCVTYDDNDLHGTAGEEAEGSEPVEEKDATETDTNTEDTESAEEDETDDAHNNNTEVDEPNNNDENQQEERHICAYNPDYEEVKRLSEKIKHMQRGLMDFISVAFPQPGVPLVSSEVESLLKKAETAIDRLLRQASVTSCGAINPARFRADLKKFRTDIFESLEEELGHYASQGQWKELYRELKARIKHLERDVKRFKNKDDVQFLEDMIGEYRDLQEEAEKTSDPEDFEEIVERFQGLDEEMKHFFEEREEAGNSKFIRRMIAEVRGHINNARQDVGQSRRPGCNAARNGLDKLENMVDDAEEFADNNDFLSAGAVLDDIDRLYHKQFQHVLGRCLLVTDVEPINIEVDDVFEGVTGVSEDLIDEMVARVTEKVTNKIQLFLNEKLKEVTARVVEMKHVAVEKVTQSLTALQSVAKEYRETMTDIKNTLITRAQELEGLAEQSRLALADRNRLYNTLETVSTYNWCGRLGDELQERGESLLEAFEEGAVSSGDIAEFEAYVTSQAQENGDVCYQIGASRFRDSASHEWYFSHFQGGPFQGTKNPDGTLTGEVEPGREALGAEALMAIMRVFNYRGIEGTDCPVIDVPQAGSIPGWANCAAAVAHNAGIDLDTPFDQPIPREKVAQIMWAALRNRGLNEGGVLAVNDTQATELMATYTDANQCTTEATTLGVMIENDIMTGNDGSWNCRGNLNRAELAAVLTRLAELKDFYEPVQ